MNRIFRITWSQALHTWAGATYTTKIGKNGGRLDQMLKNGASDRQIVDEFYLAALSRYPSARERDSLESFMARKPSRRQTVENFVWALISSGEFTYNH